MSKSMTEKGPDLDATRCLRGADSSTDDPSKPTSSPIVWKSGDRKRFLPKDVICHEGGRADRAFLIRSGLVKLVAYLPNGGARIVRLQSGEQWIGLEGLLGIPYRHTAIAVDEVEVDQCSTQSLWHLQKDDPGVFCQILCQWHSHLAQADKWISDFSTGAVRPRVARLLKYLAQLEYGESSDRVELLSVDEMADVLGVRPESVSRALAGFKRSDILHRLTDLFHGPFELDTKRLRQEARG